MVYWLYTTRTSFYLTAPEADRPSIENLVIKLGVALVEGDLVARAACCCAVKTKTPNSGDVGARKKDQQEQEQQLEECQVVSLQRLDMA